MSTSIEDVLKINMVLVGVELLADQAAQNQFTRSVGTEATLGTIIQGSVPTTLLPPDLTTGRSIALERDRITIGLAPDRALIERQFPQYDSLRRLSEVIDLALQSTRGIESRPRAFGYNIELVYTQTSGLDAQRYLAGRLFPGKRLGNPGWDLVGGAAKLLFLDNASQWTVSLDRRVNDPTGKNVFLGLNLHKEESYIPDVSEVLDGLQDIWKQAHEFVMHLDEAEV